MTKFLVTGGCGFIGSHFINLLLSDSANKIYNLDILTYAGTKFFLTSDVTFIQGDIADRPLVNQLLHEIKPDVIVNFAAETHVDRSINDSQPFLHSNVVGTHNLMCEVHNYIKDTGNDIRFIHMSTDEVFGELQLKDPSFTEDSPYRPRSPYAASKAAADHFIWSFIHTHKFPATIIHCCNNYGPHQYPEKFIPVVITKAAQDLPIPVYGAGTQMRNWIHVNDTVRAIYEIIKHGELRTNYNISDFTEISNLDLAKTIVNIMDKPESLIQFVEDRKGHDFRYSLNSNKLRKTLGWRPVKSFITGLQETVDWYLK